MAALSDENYLKKELYELIKNDESIFDFIQESSLDGLWYWDIENPENEWMNPKFWTVLGYNPDEMPHKSSAWQNIIHQDDLKVALDNFSKHCENPNHPYDQIVRYAHKNGSTVWIRCRGMAIRDKSGKPLRMLGAHHELTDVKSIEFELSKLSTHLLQAQKIGRIGSFEYFIKENIVNWSDEMYRIFGAENNKVPLTYEQVNNMIHPDDRALHIEQTRQIIENGSYSFDHRLVYPSGEIRWITGNAQMEYYTDGSPDRMLGTVQDITERKEIEVLLRKQNEELVRSIKETEEKENNYKRLFSNMTNAFALHEMLFDESGKPIDFLFLEVNPAWEKIVGIKAETVVGKRIKEVIPAIEQSWLDTYGRVVRTGISEEFLDYNAATEKYYNVFAYKHDENKFAGIFNDVTDKKLAEIELLKKQSFIENILTGITDAFFSMDNHLVVTYFNQAAGKMLNRKAEDVIGKYLFDAFPEAKGSIFDEKYQFAVKEKMNISFETYFENPPYTNWYNVNVYPLANGISVFFQVTTERKNQELELITAKEKAEENEEKYKLLLNNINDLVCEIDEDGIYTFVSEKYKSILGYNPQELIGRKAAELIHPEDLLASAERFTQLQNEMGQSINIWRFKHKNGTYRIIESKGNVYIDNFGKRKTVVISRDITEQKLLESDLIKAKEKTEESEEKYRALYNNAPLSYQSLDENGCFMDVNPMWLKTLGYNRDEVIGHWFGDFLHPDYVEHFKINFPAFKKRGYVSDVQFSLKRKDASFIYVSFEGCIGYTPDGKFKQTYCVFKDITEQKALEQHLIKAKEKAEESEKKLTEAQRVAKVGSWQFNLETNENYWSDELYRIFEFENTPIMQFYEHCLSKIHEDDRQTVSDINKQARELGKSYDIEYRIITNSGRIKYIHEIGFAKKNTDGKITSLFGTVQDITEQKMAEIQIKEAKEKAEESDRLKTAFLQNMSHEIRTPMNAIMGFASLLSKNFNNKQNLEKFSNIIESRCNDLLDIINDVLDISKIESGQTSINFENCNIIELFEELVLFFNDYKTRINKQKIELIFFPSPEETLYCIKTDKTKLKQIIINLVINALKFTETGSITCSYKLENNQLRFFVKDTGIGIPTDKYKYIFERFTQLKHPALKNLGGTGLGLPIVKGLVKLLGGDVWLESELNKGTTFYFTIDYIPAEATNMNKAFIDVNQKLNTDKTILIVEDDYYNAEYLQEAIGVVSPNVITVSNGLSAVKIVQEQKIDLILMDVRLPDITGYEASRLILKENPGIKIIAQTAFAANVESQKAKEAGCVDYISKPIKQEKLLSVIIKHLK